MESSGQDLVQSGTFWGFLNVSLLGLSQVTFTTHLEKVIIFRHYQGSQVTFMTQLQKVLVFRYRHFSLLMVVPSDLFDTA